MTLTTLSPAEIEGFHRDGYVSVKGAFARADALAMQDDWWAELEVGHGIRRDDRATWRQPLGDLTGPKHSPLEATIATARVRGAIEDLMGPGAWRPPGDWGRALVTFPGPGPWDVPAGLWHWDSPRIGGPLAALFVVSFVGEVAPGGGGTLLLAGSPRLLARQEATLPPAYRGADPATRRDLFHRSHPWLRALTGQGPSPADRVAAFMTETDIDGLPARVVELTGAPGDMVLCHPAIVHCIAPNTGDRPRFMRIKQQLKVAKTPP